MKIKIQLLPLPENNLAWEVRRVQEGLWVKFKEAHVLDPKEFQQNSQRISKKSLQAEEC